MQLVNKKVRYSPSERRLFDVLPKNGEPLSSTEIIEKVYGRKKRPYNARQVVVGTLVRLQDKLKVNHEDFRIKRSERRGPHPIEFRIEK
jgi:hypothetical protein